MTKYWLEDYYYVLNLVNDRPYAEYRDLKCLTSRDHLMEYIYREFEGTDGEHICSMTPEELMEGHYYRVEQRMGGGDFEAFIKVFHDSNIYDLYDYLDREQFKVLGEEEDESKPSLSEQFFAAETESEMFRIIEIYNDSFEGYW